MCKGPRDCEMFLPQANDPEFCECGFERIDHRPSAIKEWRIYNILDTDYQDYQDSK